MFPIATPSVIELPPTFDDVLAARERLRGRVHRTPVLTSSYFDAAVGARLFFKCENLQRIGAFKIRGATNAVAALSTMAQARGVITHSSGNHGQALALAARDHGLAATVVMPRDCAGVKIAAVRGYGARVELCAPGTRNREAAVANLIAADGATLIHPYDDRFVIAGQGTAACELLEDSPALDAIIAPVGGGGLLAGTALAAHGMNARILVVGAEPAAADDAARSLAAGRILTGNSGETIADGLRTAALGALNFPIVTAHVARIVTVSETDIIAAMRAFWERMKLIIEPSSAVAIAALLREPDFFAGKNVGVIVSGGNVDLAALPF